MSVYMIAEVEVHEPELYAQYVRQISDVVSGYGGRYLVRGGTVTPLFGDWHPQRMIVVEFPTQQDIERCFSSEEYRRIAPLRESSTSGRAVVLEATQQPEGGQTP